MNMTSFSSPSPLTRKHVLCSLNCWQNQGWLLRVGNSEQRTLQIQQMSATSYLCDRISHVTRKRWYETPDVTMREKNKTQKSARLENKTLTHGVPYLLLDSNTASGSEETPTRLSRFDKNQDTICPGYRPPVSTVPTADGTLCYSDGLISVFSSHFLLSKRPVVSCFTKQYILLSCL